MASLSGWTEAGIGILLIMACLFIIVGGMNVSYNKNNDPTFGISSNSTQQEFEGYQQQLQDSMNGEVSSSSIYGINIISSWAGIKAGLMIILDLITGNWIKNAVGLLQLGAIGDTFALMLRLLFIFSIGFIFIKILFKVKP